MSSSNQRNSLNEFGTSDAPKNELNSFNEFDSSDALNNGLTIDEIFKDQYSAQPEAGANALLLETPDNPMYQNQSAQLEDPLLFGRVTNYAMKRGWGNVQLPHQLDHVPEAYPLQFGTVANYAMNHGLGNVQLPHQLDQPKGAINMVNPSMRHQMNLCRLDKPGSSQSSNISNTDIDKRLKKRECDRKFREKKEKMRKENEAKLAKFAAENKHVKEDNARLQDGLENCQEKVSRLEEEVSDWKKEVSRSNNNLKRQNAKVEALEKLVASSEGTDPVAEIKQLKRKIELLMTQSTNPDSMKIVEIQEEKEKWERKAKRLQVINDALCDHKMNNDEK